MLGQIQQQNQELAYERDLLSTLMENFPDSILLQDLQSRFVRVRRSKLERAFASSLARHRAAQTANGALQLPDPLTNVDKLLSI